MLKQIIIPALLITSPVLAQQAPQLVQDQLILTHATIEIQLAKQLDAANAKIADLQKQIDAAKPKVEPTPTTTPK
jgi:hypothetical protein